MSDTQVHPHTTRHLELSSRYRCAWAFHQLVKGLRKVFPGEDFEDSAVEFRKVFEDLKTAADDVGTQPAAVLDERLGAVERDLEALIGRLAAEDVKLSPLLLRQFFHQVRSFDERILLEILRFYQVIQRDKPWPENRIDKVDFTVSALSEKVSGRRADRERGRLMGMLDALASRQTLDAAGSARVRHRQRAIAELRAAIGRVESFGDLSDGGLVTLYRELKHGLQGLYFQPVLLPEIVDTNAAFRHKISELLDAEVVAIFQQFEHVAELQARLEDVAPEAAAEFVSLGERVEAFRDRAKRRNVRLGEVADLKQSLDRLDAGREVETPRRRRGGGAGEIADSEVATEFGELVDQLVELPVWRAEEDQLDRHADSVPGLEPREILAFRRLVRNQPREDSLERLIATGAALRRRLEKVVRAMLLARNERNSARTAQQREVAKQALELGARQVEQFQRRLDRAVFEQRDARAAMLRRLHMRFTRTHSGLWLLVYPSTTE